jgi:hypothetical protein
MNQSNATSESLIASEDLAVLDLYLNPAIALEEIALKLNLSIPSLLDMLERPEITAFLQRLTAMNDRRARDIALMAMPTNIARLQHLGETATNPELARKCLSAVVRVATRREAPGRSAGKHERAVPQAEFESPFPEAFAPPHESADSPARDHTPESNLTDAATDVPVTHPSTRSPRGPRPATQLMQSAGTINPRALNPSVAPASA